MTMDARKLGVAFRLGWAFGRGMAFAMSKHMAQDGEQDSDEKDVQFRTSENGHVIAIKDGKVVGGAGAKVGQDGMPTLNFFAANPQFEGKSFSYKVKMYAKQVLKSKLETLQYPKGMPPDCARIELTSSGLGELASKMNDDKALALPFIPQVYREGAYRTALDSKHPDIEFVVYTTALVEVSDGRKLKVEIQSKKSKGKGDYRHYGIAKADEEKEKTSNAKPDPNPNRRNDESSSDDQIVALDSINGNAVYEIFNIEVT